MYFALLADHSVKIKEIEKRDKYLDLARELKKTIEHESDSDTNCGWCIGTIPKGLVKEWENLEISGQVETMQITALLRSARILRGVLMTLGDLMSNG